MINLLEEIVKGQGGFFEKTPPQSATTAGAVLPSASLRLAHPSTTALRAAVPLPFG